MKVEYTSDGILVSVKTEGNPYLNETFKTTAFGDKITSSPIDINKSLSLAIAAIATRLETCEVSDMSTLTAELDKAERVWARWFKKEVGTW